MKVLLDRDPFEHRDRKERFGFRPWPASWIHLHQAGDPDGPVAGEPPFVLAYRCRFTADRDDTIRIHVSADERYELFLDGRRIGRGPERGTPLNWFFESYELSIAAGEHTLVARVWSLGQRNRLAPLAQMHVHHGFLLGAEGAWNDAIGTGVGAWEAKRLGGYAFIDPRRFSIVRNPVVGAPERIDASAFDFGFERGEGEGWSPVQVLGPGRCRGFPYGQAGVEHHLRPAMLPAQLDEARQIGTVRFAAPIDPQADSEETPVDPADHDRDTAARWQAMLTGDRPVTVAPGSRLRLIVDLDNYFCAYPQITVSGGRGSEIELLWTEALYEQPERNKRVKGNRDRIDGKYFLGYGDQWLPDGQPNRTFRPLWWRAGRYVQLIVRTGDEPVAIDRLEFIETRYPLTADSRFASEEQRLSRVAPILLRGLQMCMHETYFDCPYYEQLMYVGDTRLEVLTTYALTHDDRLPRKALAMFDWSRMPNGLTQSRFPSSLTQIIPPFSLWWVCMVGDFAMWRGDKDFVASLMPGVRSVMETFRATLNGAGLVEVPPGWNFVDWDKTWTRDYFGASPDAATHVSGPINWQMVLALRAKAQIEQWLGEPALAQRDRDTAASVAASAIQTFWSDSRRMLADDADHRLFSEHSQCLALISGMLDADRAAQAATQLFEAPDLARATIYFSHYLFEACRATRRIDKLFERLEQWYDLADNGLKTPIEQPEPTRSDCHAWGSHPLFHMRTSIVGIRPAAPGFEKVIVEPQLGPLALASGAVPHPQGEITVDLWRADGNRIVGSVFTPESVTGTVIVNGRTLPIEGGRCEFT